jgi:hypothetical protein
MEKFQIFAIAYGCLFAIGLGFTLTFLVQRLSRSLNIHTKQFVFHYILPWLHRISSRTLGRIVQWLLLLALYSFLLLFRDSRSWQTVGKNTGILAVITMMPLYLGLDTHFAAFLIYLPLQTYHAIHRDISIMASLLTCIHVLVMSLKNPVNPLRKAVNLHPFVVRLVTNLKLSG